jgi:hypothetical protein
MVFERTQLVADAAATARAPLPGREWFPHPAAVPFPTRQRNDANPARIDGHVAGEATTGRHSAESVSCRATRPLPGAAQSGVDRRRRARRDRLAHIQRVASRALFAVALAVGVLVAGGCNLPWDGRGDIVAQPSGDTGSASLMPSQGPLLLTVDVNGEAGTVLKLTVRDRSGLTLSARSATQNELRAHDAVLGHANAVVRNLDDTHILLVWLGTSCDRSATLDIDPGWTSLQLQNGPRPACDLVGDPRGVVLETRDTVRTNQTQAHLSG